MTSSIRFGLPTVTEPISDDELSPTIMASTKRTWFDALCLSEDTSVHFSFGNVLKKVRVYPETTEVNSVNDKKVNFTKRIRDFEEKFKRIPEILDYSGFESDEWSHTEVILPIDCWEGDKKVNKCYEITHGEFEEGGFYVHLECKNRRKSDQVQPNRYDLDWEKNEWITRGEWLRRNGVSGKFRY